MSTYTPYLDLLKKNPATEGTDTFNITTMLNDNWDKIDSGLATRAIRPNLLDNWYFVGGGSQQGGGQFPINQRGKTSYTGAGYSIDRWRIWNANVTASLASGGLTLRNSDSSALQQFVQYLTAADTSALSGKTATLSMLMGGQLYSTTGTLGSAFSVETPTCKLQTSVGNGGLVAAQIWPFKSTTTGTIQAIKLELGSTQTLAHQENGVWVLNEYPNHQQELARCQRFYYNVNKISVNGYRTCGLAIATTYSTLSMVLPLPVPMRTTPAVTYIGEWWVSGGSGYGSADLTGIALSPANEQCGGNLVALTLTATGANLTVGQPYMLQAAADPTADICLSADL